jgi:flavin-dependent dehydrogenase
MMAAMPVDFDVIVAGAGPAGTAAAYHLRLSGYKVLLLDRQQFPRVKPCGGGISIKALNLIPWSITPVLEQTIKRICVGIKGTTNVRCEVLETEHPICAFAVRKEFDHFNFEKTIESGVEFQNISELSEIKEHRDRVQVVIDRRQLTSRFLIGADGANSEVRRLINAGASFYRGLPSRGQLTTRSSAVSRPRNYFLVMYRMVMPGNFPSTITLMLESIPAIVT